jgi:Flp pilus assembly protein CpaB
VLGPKPRVPVVSLLPGEAIVSRRLSSPEAGTGMASRVPMDKRGFPIRVDNWIADAKLVYPGAVVDVIATVTDPVERTPITMTVLQRLTVLAVNGHVDAAAAPDPTNPQDGRRPDGAVVTVLVSPGEAEILALSAREGKLDLTLRNANDAENVATQGTNPFLLTGRAYPGSTTTVAAAPPPPAAAPVRRSPTPPGEMRRGREPAEERPEPAGSVQTIRIGGK